MKTVKVYIRYSDGRCTMTETRFDGPNTVDIPEEDWREYLAHCETDNGWQDHMLQLRNEMPWCEPCRCYHHAAAEHAYVEAYIKSLTKS